ncbi:MAG: hypothetical protein ABEJ55_05610 [Halanaeroarchaeum sp.]
MDTVVDLLDLPHPDDALALQRGRREYEYRRFRATAYKTGNYLRQCAVREGATVSLHDLPEPETVFGLLGAGLLGGRARFDPDGSVAADVLLGPTAALSDDDPEPGRKRIGFGEKPEDPTVAYFEREVWSENPFFPPSAVEGDARFLDGLTQGEALGLARTVSADLSPDDVVAVRGSFADPSTVIGGVLAPLVVGATVLLPADDQEGTVAVGGTNPPESALLEVPSDLAPDG